MVLFGWFCFDFAGGFLVWLGLGQGGGALFGYFFFVLFSFKVAVFSKARKYDANKICCSFDLKFASEVPDKSKLSSD